MDELAWILLIGAIASLGALLLCAAIAKWDHDQPDEPERSTGNEP